MRKGIEYIGMLQNGLKYTLETEKVGERTV